jgi:hypothetical protein
MAFPAARFIPRPADERLPLRLPVALSGVSAPRSAPASTAPPAPVPPAALTLSANGVDPVDLAVEFARIVPASGNLAGCGQQFWLGPDRAGTTITFWADTTVVHPLVNGIRLKTVPSRLTTAHLRRKAGILLAHHRSAPAAHRRARPSRSTAQSTPSAPSA